MKIRISNDIKLLCRVLTILLLLGTTAFPSAAQKIKFGNSYLNLSKKTVGGTVQPGDTLEIRTNIWIPNNYNGGNIYFARYIDNVPVKTTFADDSLRIITNEGLTYKNWTLAAGDDPGRFNVSPSVGQYHVKINFGRNATAPTNTSNDATGAGYIITTGTSKDRPRAGGNILLTTSFKVRVTGGLGDTIILGAGEIRYKKTNNAGDADTVISVNQYKVLITQNDPICPNAIGRNFIAEAGGTFDSGSVQNRSYAPTFLIPGYTYLNNVGPSQSINDGFYAILNNLSPWASTYQNADKRPNCTAPTGGSPPTPQSCSNRMFSGHWDIIGDHTGSATAAGNAPTASGSPGGYMLVVNADHATSEAYRQNITGLCPNTTYEFSLWVKNVCSNCGADSTGTQTFKPGVYPNLSFAIDDLDRYTTGQIDTTGWMKKGFLFKTGASQTSISVSIRNNASGGGGNDWAIDDISLVTCNPDLLMTPSDDHQVCYGQQVDIQTTVSSFFNNYVHYRFERSVDAGATWTVPYSGTGSPTPVSGGYEYIAKLVPSFIADSSHHLNQYRFVVASSPANLNNTECSFTANTKIIVMVNDCSVILSTRDSTQRLTRVVTRTGGQMEVVKLVNPFLNRISFDLIVTEDRPATIVVFDQYGREIRTFRTRALKGYNHIILDKLSTISRGTYYLRVQAGQEVINKIMIKS